jgi:hypothetical protein
MDFAVIQKVLRAFAPHGLKEVIPSTIGEPTLYPQFGALLELCAELNLKLNLTTNGDSVAHWMPKLAPVLSDLKISALHGHLTQEQTENLNEVFRIRDEKKNFTVTLQCAVAENDSVTPDERFDRVKILPLWKINETNAASPPAKGACPFLGREAWVWMDGTFQVCPNPDARYGQRTPFPFGDFGNFATADPLEIWEHACYRQFVQEYKKHPICKSCRMRKIP